MAHLSLGCLKAVSMEESGQKKYIVPQATVSFLPRQNQRPPGVALAFQEFANQRKVANWKFVESLCGSDYSSIHCRNIINQHMIWYNVWNRFRNYAQKNCESSLLTTPDRMTFLFVNQCNLFIVILSFEIWSGEDLFPWHWALRSTASYYTQPM